jgi:hypothetical protein
MPTMRRKGPNPGAKFPTVPVNHVLHARLVIMAEETGDTVGRIVERALLAELERGRLAVANRRYSEAHREAERTLNPAPDPAKYYPRRG